MRESRRTESLLAVVRARRFLATRVAKDGDAGATTAPAAPTAATGPARATFAGIPIVIDRPKGHVQEGTGADGKPWRRVYHVDYGYIDGTNGGDGEGLDVFVGGDASAAEAHWISQIKADGSFDELKLMLGFADRESAKAIYLAHVPRRYFGSITSTPLDFVKALLGVEPAPAAAAEAGFAKALASLEVVSKPFGGFATFDACVARMKDEGHDDEAARKICGRLQADEEGTEKAASARVVAKAEAGELRYVLGIVLEPDVVDAQGDTYSVETVRQAAWTYMTRFRNLGRQHKGLINHKVELVESFVAPCDMAVEGVQIRAGTWLMGLHVTDDDLWDDVKSGALTGLSIGGFAWRTPLTA